MKRIMRSTLVIVVLTLLVTAGLMAAQTNEADSTCPLPMNFWLVAGVDWPVNGLQLGIRFYTQAEIIALTELSVPDDASLTLAFQLAAAKLNIANDSDPLIIRDVLLEGDRLLAAYDTVLPYAISSDNENAEIIQQASRILEIYNSGQLTLNCISVTLPAPLATAEITVPEPATTEQVKLQPVTTPEVIAPPASTPEVGADDDDGSGQGRGRGRGRGGDDNSDDD